MSFFLVFYNHLLKPNKIMKRELNHFGRTDVLPMRPNDGLLFFED